MQPLSSPFSQTAWVCVTGLSLWGITVGQFLSFTPTAQPQPVPQTQALDPNEDDRGSGRLRYGSPVLELSFRGSGRISPNPSKPGSVQAGYRQAYRGSGRIDPAQS
jgi:hypothetical protein